MRRASRARAGATRSVLALAAAWLIAAPAARAQTPQTAVHPSDIYVGDVFRAVVAVEVPPGVRIVFPDTLAAADEVEAAGRRELRSDTTATGGLRLIAAYPLAAWRPGTRSLPHAEIRVLGDGYERTLVASFPEFEVSSVLPADAEEVEPKELKDVLGADRVMWPWLLGAALLLALLVAAVIWRRRRRPGVAEPFGQPVVDPRAAALAALADERGVALAGNGELRRLYIELSDTLRYLIAVEMPGLGHELTTTELAPRLDDAMDASRAEVLRGLLRRADLVKFARARPSAARALDDWRAARLWVEAYAPPVPAGVDEEVMAMSTAADDGAAGDVAR